MSCFGYKFHCFVRYSSFSNLRLELIRSLNLYGVNCILSVRILSASGIQQKFETTTPRPYLKGWCHENLSKN